MNVIQYTNIYSETITEEVPVVTTTYETRTKVIEKAENLYEVTLTQEQVDVIVAITGNVIGGGPNRRLTDGIWTGLSKYATKEKMNSSYRKHSFKDFFVVKESSIGNCGYIVTKE